MVRFADADAAIAADGRPYAITRAMQDYRVMFEEDDYPSLLASAVPDLQFTSVGGATTCAFDEFASLMLEYVLILGEPAYANSRQLGDAAKASTWKNQLTS